jgi:hypothetical protein
MKKNLIIISFLFTAVFVYAQTRNDIMIHIPMPTGGTSTEQTFFKDNFEMETIAAGYATTENVREADYTLKLEVKPNMIMYDDGTEELAPPDEPQNILELRLFRNEDNTEVVMFNFPFTEVEEMYDFNLFLLYQAMANVPLTKLTAMPDTDHWRNKWLYIRASFDYTVISYMADTSKPNSQTNPAYGLSPSQPERTGLAPDNSYTSRSSLGGTIGIEFQFLNWMSAEAYAKLLFGDTGGSAFVPTVGVELKFPLKPSKHFMLEPYALVEFPLNSGSGILKWNVTGLGGGMQFGVKGGEMGAFFVDANYVYDIGEIHIRENAREAYWNRWTLSFALGYKIGFFNRNKEEE